MNHVGRMGCFQRLYDLIGEIDCLGYGERTALQDRRQRLAFEPLGHDVRDVSFCAQAADLENVGVS